MTPSQLGQLKRDAKRLAKADGVKHCEALERLAQEAGYRTYAALKADVKPNIVHSTGVVDFLTQGDRRFMVISK